MDIISGLRAEAGETHLSVQPDVATALSLDGRTAVVTGAASGIGRQTAITYSHAGARVVLADRAEEGLEETASLVEGAVVAPTDVTSKTEVDDLARPAIRASGRIDVWANVAGIIRNSLVVDTTRGGSRRHPGGQPQGGVLGMCRRRPGHVGCRSGLDRQCGLRWW